MMLIAAFFLLQGPGLNTSDAAIAEHLKPLGGTLQYVKEGKWELSLDVQNDRRTFDFGEVRDLTNLAALRIFRGSVNERTLPQLRSLANIHLLVMLTDGLSDAGLAEICKLTRLDKLDVMSKRITANGLAHLPELTHLKRLFLYNTTIGDAEIGPLCNLKNLGCP